MLLEAIKNKSSTYPKVTEASIKIAKFCRGRSILTADKHPLQLRPTSPSLTPNIILAACQHPSIHPSIICSCPLLIFWSHYRFHRFQDPEQQRRYLYTAVIRRYMISHLIMSSCGQSRLSAVLVFTCYKPSFSIFIHANKNRAHR